MSDFDRLLSVRADARDAAWELSFLRSLPTESIRVLSPEPQSGPDGWPYLLVETGPGADEPARGPIEWLATRGIGMVVNPRATAGGATEAAPDFVLTYGMTWNFRERGEFITTSAGSTPAAPLAIRPGETLLTGVPSEGFLPGYVRKVLRQFFLDQSVFAPKILLVGPKDRPDSLDLAFSLESLGSPPEREHAGVLEALSWFLPGHYALAVVSEKAVPGDWRAL